MDIYKCNVQCISHATQKYPHWDGTVGVRESTLFKNLVTELFWSFSDIIARKMLPARRHHRGYSDCTYTK
jgi:hypothetical protein